MVIPVDHVDACDLKPWYVFVLAWQERSNMHLIDAYNGDCPNLDGSLLFSKVLCGGLSLLGSSQT